MRPSEECYSERFYLDRIKDQNELFMCIKNYYCLNKA